MVCFRYATVNTVHKGDNKDDDGDDDDDDVDNNNDNAVCLWQVHSLWQSKFSTEYDLVLPLSISDILISSRFLKVIQKLLTSSSSSSLHFCIPFNNLFEKAVLTQDMTSSVSTISSFNFQYAYIFFFVFMSLLYSLQ